jgi:hypothetical protein
MIINYTTNTRNHCLWSDKSGSKVISLLFRRDSIESQIGESVYWRNFVFEGFPTEVREDIGSLGRSTIFPDWSNRASVGHDVKVKFIDVDKSPLLCLESLVGFFKRLPLLDQYTASDRAHDKEAEGQICNSNRRVSDASIGFCCLVISAIAFGHALRYGIYKARSRRQHAIAAFFIVVFFPIAIQGSLSLLNSASLDCSPEDIGILSIVIPKLEFSDVEMQVLLADLVVSSDNTALEDRPEAFNRIGMNNVTPRLGAQTAGGEKGLGAARPRHRR